jgi:hypothetical protein
MSEMCTYVTGGKNSGNYNRECPNGDSCERSHNRVEEFYHPDKYKAKFCASYLNGPAESLNGQSVAEKCDYQEFCSFAHTREELSIELIEDYVIDMDFYMYHFKTVWCPYRDDDHDRKICVYSHNWQDYRRKPAVFTYS